MEEDSVRDRGHGTRGGRLVSAWRGGVSAGGSGDDGGERDAPRPGRAECPASPVGGGGVARQIRATGSVPGERIADSPARVQGGLTGRLQGVLG